jgi:acyl-CoA synthetase (AMP-forming)/AMP-acid ligase II
LDPRLSRHVAFSERRAGVRGPWKVVDAAAKALEPGDTPCIYLQTTAVLRYEELLVGEVPDFAWPDLDERSAAAMCYTSGTTGNPKGVVYSHRSTFLHSLGVVSAEALGINGWLRTGDVGTIDPLGYIHISDRAKDVIKSGGEWISSLELEAAIVSHPRRS